MTPIIIHSHVACDDDDDDDDDVLFFGGGGEEEEEGREEVVEWSVLICGSGGRSQECQQSDRERGNYYLCCCNTPTLAFPSLPKRCLSLLPLYPTRRVRIVEKDCWMETWVPAKSWVGGGEERESTQHVSVHVLAHTHAQSGDFTYHLL